MKERWTAVVCLVLACYTSAAAADMSHEETIVRTAYAKFAYAAQQGAIGQLASEAFSRETGGTPEMRKSDIGLTSEQRLAAAQVNFTLGDFVVGDVRDILDRKVNDLVPPEAVGEELRSGGVAQDFNDLGLKTHLSGLYVEWQPAHGLSLPAMEVVAAMTMRDWLNQRPETLWQRYASYSVTVSYQGKSRGPYKALFLFGHNAKGDEVVQPVDTTTNANGLATAFSEKLFPDTLVLTRWRNYRVVSDWLDANQTDGGSCFLGQGDVCCDLIKLKCGPRRTDATNARAKPLPGWPTLGPHDN